MKSSWSWSSFAMGQEHAYLKAEPSLSTCPQTTSDGQVGKSVPAFIENIPDDYSYEERAAIMEFDGGMSREEAEKSALEDARKNNGIKLSTVVQYD